MAAKHVGGWRRGGVVKVLLITLGVMAVVLVVLVVLLPRIVGGMVPGMIARSTGGMSGKVSVERVSLSWGGPQEVGGLQVRGPAGEEVVKVDVSLSSGLLGLVSGGDVGTLAVSGKVNLTRGEDGTTNLERATATGGGGTVQATAVEPNLLPLGRKVALAINGLDVMYREVDKAGATTKQASINQLKGQAVVDLITAGGVATADFAAGVSDGATSSGLMVKVAMKGFVDAQGALAARAAQAEIRVMAEALPVALIDALAKQQGVLLAAVGPALKVDVTAKTEGAAGMVDAQLSGENLSAKLGLTLKDGRLTASSESVVAVKSTAFAERVPAVRDGLARAGLAIANWPGVSATLRGLDVPAGNLGEADLRGGRIEAAVSVGAVTGTVRSGEAVRKVALEPMTLALSAADLAGVVTLKGQTQATVDGQAAGRVMADVQASGLLDEKGRLAALVGGKPGSVTGRVEAVGISAEVLQPVLAGMNVPINVRDDLGPTLDVAADVRQAGEAVEVDARVQSQRLQLSAPVRLAGGMLTGRGPIVLSMQGSANVINGLLSRGGSPAVVLSGRGGIEATVADLSVHTAGGFDLGKLSATVDAQVSDLSAALPSGPAEMVTVRTLTARAEMKPGQAVLVRGVGDAAYGGKGFGLKTELSIAGLPEGLKNGQMVPGVGPVRVTGVVDVTDAPTALAKMAGGQSPVVAELIRGLLGETVTANVRLAGESSGQSVAAKVNAKNLTTSVSAELSAAAVKVSAIEAEATVRPDTAQALLRASGQSEQAVAGIAMQQPARVSVRVAPMVIPVQTVAGKLAVRTDQIEQVEASMKLLDPLLVSGIPVGERRLSGGLSGLTAEAVVPGPASGRKMTASAKGEVMLDASKRVASLAMKAEGAADGSTLDASAGLTQIDTVAADGVMGEPGLVSGALGAQANVTLTAKRTSKGGAMATTVQVDSPALTTGVVGVELGADRVSLAGPAQVRWTVQPGWAERFVLSGRDEQGRVVPGSMRVTQPMSVVLDVKRLVAALPASGADGQATAGPMKPGVFALEATGSVASLNVQPMGRDGRGQMVIMGDEVALTGITAAVNSDAAGAVGFEAKVGELVQGGVKVPRPLTVVGRVRNLADGRGVVNTAGALLDVEVAGDRVPVALIDQLGDLNGQAVMTLGTTMVMQVKGVNVGRGTGGGTVDVRVSGRGMPPTAVAQGKAALPVDANAEIASLAVGGPIRDGVLDLSGAGAQPLSLKLTQFKYDVNAKLLKMFPLFASASKTPWTGPGPVPPGRGPLVIGSRNLRVPVDGDMRKLNGAIDVDIGVIEYQFREVLGEFLDSTIFTGGGEQKPILPFTVNVVNGVATYDKFEIPVRNFFIKNRGTVDLVNNTVDVITYIPTVAASKGLIGKLNSGAASGFGKVLPDVLSEGTMIPLRVRGPMDNPKYSIDFDLFFKEFGDQLIKQPGKLIEGVLDGLLKPKNR